MQLDEQEIRFRKQARRRLVGAIALVLLMVTILPMILDDHSAVRPQPEISLTIPGQDDEDFAASLAQPAPQAAVSGTPESTGAVPVSPGPGIQTGGNAAAPGAHAEERLATRTPDAAEKNSYVIQIGVFSDIANVKLLEQKLQANGFQAQSEKLNGAQGEQVRLRIGPFASRTLAEAALDKIRNVGLPGMILVDQ